MTISDTVQLDLEWQDASGWDALPPDAETRLGEIIRATIARTGLAGMFQVSMLVTTDKKMQRVNRRYRGIDKATDVLSFPQSDIPLLLLPPDQSWVARPFGDDTHHAEMPFTVTPDGEMIAPVHPPGAETPRLENANPYGLASGDEDKPRHPVSQSVHLGDIMISTETVARQAREAGHSAWWELCFLTAHGALHLLGYDDYYLPGYQAMVAIQEAVLAELGITREGNAA